MYIIWLEPSPFKFVLCEEAIFIIRYVVSVPEHREYLAQISKVEHTWGVIINSDDFRKFLIYIGEQYKHQVDGCEKFAHYFDDIPANTNIMFYFGAERFGEAGDYALECTCPLCNGFSLTCVEDCRGTNLQEQIAQLMKTNENTKYSVKFEVAV